MRHPDGVDRAELALVLRRARARIEPADVGLPEGRHRRVPGLRREEVAMLAGVSVDYVVRLEQGRGPHPSTSVLAALARALRLDRDERDQLFRLAGGEPPLPGRIVDHVRPSVLRLLDRLTDLPALLLDAKSDVLAWNEMATALLGDMSAWAVGRRNIAWQRFLGGGSRVASSPEETAETEVQSVAGLRAASARYPDDPGLRRLVTELRESSARFEQLWSEGRSGQWRSHRKTIVHPELGAITLDCDTLHVPDDDQLVIVYSAPAGSPEASALALLRVLGGQRMSSATND
ncbi:MAG: putative transcriptional regulator, family [Ilumatobacteraceae bacterium]|nr:putative transcriptional regulator, family [Ilumatobacteraceae bacterium]